MPLRQDRHEWRVHQGPFAGQVVGLERDAVLPQYPESQLRTW